MGCIAKSVIKKNRTTPQQASKRMRPVQLSQLFHNGLIILAIFSTQLHLRSYCAFANPPKNLIIIGDSISEGYGVAKESSYPELIEKSLKNWKVTNSSVSGSTSASASTRVAWALKSKPQAILLALGANDGLRGLDSKEMEKNLSTAIDLAQKAGVKVLLAGMLAPPNYGKEYTTRFAAVFPHLAKKKKIPLYPFLLEGVAGKAKFNLPDGIHPNEAGQKKIKDALLPFLMKELP